MSITPMDLLELEFLKVYPGLESKQIRCIDFVSLRVRLPVCLVPIPVAQSEELEELVEEDGFGDELKWATSSELNATSERGKMVLDKLQSYFRDTSGALKWSTLERQALKSEVTSFLRVPRRTSNAVASGSSAATPRLAFAAALRATILQSGIYTSCDKSVLHSPIPREANKMIQPT